MSSEDVRLMPSDGGRISVLVRVLQRRGDHVGPADTDPAALASIHPPECIFGSSTPSHPHSPNVFLQLSPRLLPTLPNRSIYYRAKGPPSSRSSPLRLRMGIQNYFNLDGCSTPLSINERNRIRTRTSFDLLTCTACLSIDLCGPSSHSAGAVALRPSPPPAEQWHWQNIDSMPARLYAPPDELECGDGVP